MKRILSIGTILTTVVLALILWGLVKSPQFSDALTQKTQKLKTLLVSPKDEALSADTLKIKEEKEAFAQLMKAIEVAKVNYETTLKEYKTLDTKFTALVMKSRKNPDPNKIKSEEAKLNQKFEELNNALKNYQSKATELYRFQSEELSNKTLSESDLKDET